MSAVLRIALGYFSIAPVQRWINIFGAGLLLLALATLLPGTSGAVAGVASFPVELGLVLISFVPLMLGGAVLRYSSSRSVLHLRPHGRLRMLCGATLAITLVASFGTLAILRPLRIAAAGWHLPLPLPASLFMLAWGCTALVWLGVFVASGSRLGMMLIWVVPAVVSWVTSQLTAHALIWPVVPLAGLIGWAGLALWYKTANAGQGWQWMPARPAADSKVASREDAQQSGSADELVSPALAQRKYLLDIASLQTHLLIGVGVLLLVLLLQVPMRHESSVTRMTALMLGLPQALMMFYAMLGQSAARRARFLWLRAGLNRQRLFSLTEHQGLAAASLGLGIPLLGTLLMSFLYRPDLAAAATLSTMVGAAFAIALFYWGLSLTSGRSLLDITQSVVIALSFILQFHVLQFNLHQPSRAGAISLDWELGILIVLGLLLRWYARLRWQSLDWRRLRMPPRTYRLN